MTGIVVFIGASVVVVLLTLALLYLVSEERKLHKLGQLQPMEPDADEYGDEQPHYRRPF